MLILYVSGDIPQYFLNSAKYFKDEKCGEWFGYLHYDNTPSHSLKGNIFKGPFHLPLMLILIDRIENGLPIL